MADARVVGLLHPGDMGAAVGAVLRERRYEVLWASAGRSARTSARAEAAGLRDVGTAAELARASDVVLSICPPDRAAEVAASVAGFDGLFADLNAIAPRTTRELEQLPALAAATYVDGGIIGLPPESAGSTRLYLAGPHADAVAELFAGTRLEPIAVDAEVGSASALKLSYAAWTKGSQALLLTARALAREEGVEDELLAEWAHSQPGLEQQHERAAAATARKGWRWVGEMEEIADALDAHDLPDGFHRAAAETFRRG